LYDGYIERFHEAEQSTGGKPTRVVGNRGIKYISNWGLRKV